MSDQPNTHTLDAAGRPVGRIASEIARLLRGKNRTDFSYHHDHGDAVNVLNVSKMIFTGKKATRKIYHRHSGYPGSIKSVQAGDRLLKHPDKLLRNAVYDMLPDNKLRAKMINRLTIMHE